MRTVMTSFLICMFIISCATVMQSKDQGDVIIRDLQQLVERNEIIDRINEIGFHADRRDWQSLTECFAERVLLDYTATEGGDPVKLIPEEIAVSWRGLLSGFHATQHQITNHKITIRGDEADSFSYVTVYHFLPTKSGNDTWTLIGYYGHHLIRTGEGWKVDKMKFTPTVIEGNTDLPRLAREAVALRKKDKPIQR